MLRSGESRILVIHEMRLCTKYENLSLQESSEALTKTILRCNAKVYPLRHPERSRRISSRDSHN